MWLLDIWTWFRPILFKQTPDKHNTNTATQHNMNTTTRLISKIQDTWLIWVGFTLHVGVLARGTLPLKNNFGKVTLGWIMDTWGRVSCTIYNSPLFVCYCHVKVIFPVGLAVGCYELLDFNRGCSFLCRVPRWGWIISAVFVFCLSTSMLLGYSLEISLGTKWQLQHSSTWISNEGLLLWGVVRVVDLGQVDWFWVEFTYMSEWMIWAAPNVGQVTMGQTTEVPSRNDIHFWGKMGFWSLLREL